MAHRRFACSTGLLLLAIGSVAAQDPDFSGRWVLVSPAAAAPDTPDVMSVRQTITRTNIRGEPVKPFVSALTIERDAETLAFLRQARAQLGSPQRIAAIIAFRVEGTRVRGAGDINRDRFDHSILFPDSYRSMTRTVTTVMDGPRYWRQFHQPVPWWNPTPEEERDVRRRVRLGFVETCLTVLLRAPGGAPVVASRTGRKTYGDVTGDAVEFTITDGGTREYLFDEKTRHPLGFAGRWRSAGSTGSDATFLVVERFTKHETVSGVRVPVSSHEFSPDASGASVHRATIERAITIDPPLTSTDFREPEKRP